MQRGGVWAAPAPQEAAFPLTAAPALAPPVRAMVSAPARVCCRLLPAARRSPTSPPPTRRIAAMPAAHRQASRTRPAPLEPERVRPLRLTAERLTPEHARHPVRETAALTIFRLAWRRRR